MAANIKLNTLPMQRVIGRKESRTRMVGKLLKQELLNTIIKTLK